MAVARRRADQTRRPARAGRGGLSPATALENRPDGRFAGRRDWPAGRPRRRTRRPVQCALWVALLPSMFAEPMAVLGPGCVKTQEFQRPQGQDSTNCPIRIAKTKKFATGGRKSGANRVLDPPAPFERCFHTAWVGSCRQRPVGPASAKGPEADRRAQCCNRRLSAITGLSTELRQMTAIEARRRITNVPQRGGSMSRSEDRSLNLNNHMEITSIWLIVCIPTIGPI
jgi:hypothetical protein